MQTIQKLITDNIDLWASAKNKKNITRGRTKNNTRGVYGIQKMRELILELAITGKLVSEKKIDLEENKVFEDIEAEIKKLTEEGIISKRKQLTPIIDDEKKFNGYANLPPVAERAEAFFSMQPDTAMPLPAKVFFPVAHTRELLDKAEKGGKLFSAHIFFGAEPDRALKRTSSVIGARQAVKNEDRLGQLAAQDYYPIQIAYFDPKSTEAIPEYEITFHMLPNGVVAYYEVDYGTFAIDAELVDAKPLPKPNCS